MLSVLHFPDYNGWMPSGFATRVVTWSGFAWFFIWNKLAEKIDNKLKLWTFFLQELLDYFCKTNSFCFNNVANVDRLS